MGNLTLNYTQRRPCLLLIPLIPSLHAGIRKACPSALDALPQGHAVILACLKVEEKVIRVPADFNLSDEVRQEILEIVVRRASSMEQCQPRVERIGRLLRVLLRKDECDESLLIDNVALESYECMM